MPKLLHYESWWQTRSSLLTSPLVLFTKTHSAQMNLAMQRNSETTTNGSNANTNMLCVLIIECVHNHHTFVAQDFIVTKLLLLLKSS